MLWVFLKDGKMSLYGMINHFTLQSNSLIYIILRLKHRANERRMRQKQISYWKEIIGQLSISYWTTVR